MESESERSNKEEGSDSGFDESSRWSVFSRSSSGQSSARLPWHMSKPSNLSEIDVSDVNSKPPWNVHSFSVDDDELGEQGSESSEMHMMKEKFSKLLLGEDMSGSGKGVCPALTLSNAITNLYAAVFGQLWKLEPLKPEKKSMWKREMGWFLCVSDFIVVMVPSLRTLPDGSRVEVMSGRPRVDLDINLPALRKLDNMLLEILDGYTDPEFWYIDQGPSKEVGKSVSFRKTMERQEGKWWLPLPRVPIRGLPEGTRSNLNNKLECASQIFKAASAINSSVLADMEVPESYMESLPKSGRLCLGDVIYRFITSEQFSPESLLDCLNLSSEHAALELANRVESAIYSWIRRIQYKYSTKESLSAKSSWDIVRILVQEGDKRGLLVKRAQNLLRSIKQRYTGLAQTALDTSKIQGNKDVGKAILESYSRVLESLAFTIMTRIEDLMYVDDMNKHKLPSRLERVEELVKVCERLDVSEVGPESSHQIMSRKDPPSEGEAKPRGVGRYHMYSSLI